MKTTKKSVISKLSSLGYKISEKDSFNYVNKGNPPEIWNARACYIIEKDSGLSFCNINARRDENFKLLQEYRKNDFIINGRVYEL